MAIDILINRKQPGQIGLLSLDATLSEGHNFANEVTQFPIEDGADISDHIRVQPESLRIEGFVTNSPIPALGGNLDSVIADATIAFVDRGKRVQTAFDYLLGISGRALVLRNGQTYIGSQKVKPQLVEIITGLVSYTDMALVNLDMPRDAALGDALKFSAEFRKIAKVRSEVVAIPNVRNVNNGAPRIAKQGQNKADMGKQSTTAATTAGGQRSSLAIQALKLIGVGR